MRFIKGKFHPDLRIRYARKINKGVMQVSKRDDTNKWSYLRWHLTSAWYEFKHVWPIALMLALLTVWTYSFQFILDNYADGCTLNLFGLKLSLKISFWLGQILPLLLYMVATSIAVIVMVKQKINSANQWKIDLKRSNQFYIVESRRNIKFIKAQRIVFGVAAGIAGISCLYLAWFSGTAGYHALAEYGYSMNDLNQALITECYQGKPSS